MNTLVLPWPPAILSPNKRVHWATSEDDALRAYLQHGKSIEDIAGICGRSTKAVRNRAYRLGLLENREWTEKQIETIKQMYRSDVPIEIEKICEATGKSFHAVHVKASRMGLGDFSRKRVLVRKDRPKFSSKEERSAHLSAARKRHLSLHGHPRGMAGKSHSLETKARLSETSRQANQNRTDEQRVEYLMKAMKTKMKNGTYVQERQGTTWKSGWREIGGIRKYYRSKWEANYAYYLEWLKQLGHIKSWAHESKTFWFEGVKRGCVSYLPDFHVVENDGSEAYHEVKGWMDARSITKIKRMAKYHPNVKLIVIDSKGYEAIRKKVAGLVPGWEA